MNSTPSRARGFTLLEITVAAALLTIVVAFVYSLLGNTVRGTEMVRKGLEAPKVQNAILTQIFRDFRYLWWPDLAGNAGFVGKNQSVSGKEADRVDFVTARRTRLARLEEAGDKDPGESPLTEVGYALRANDEHPEWLELWRREDFFVDDDPTAGGTYSLVYDKILKFELTYYPNPKELAPTDKGLEEWDSRIRKAIPYAIIVQIDFDVGDPPERNEKRESQHITRIILLRGGAEDAAEWAQPQDAAQPGGQPGGQPAGGPGVR